MTTKIFESSDSARSSRPLKHVKTADFEAPLSLELGGSLPRVTVAYETYGTLNAARDNAILICHALSGDSHAAAHDEEDDPGWWDIVVGPGKAIDTDSYYVICPNILGGCRGTTGPNSIDPETGRRYGDNFPTVTTLDIVETQKRLIEHLGISRLLAVVGGSMGGQQVLTWATRHPGRVAGAVAVATSARLTTQALAFDIVGRNAIRRDPNFEEGDYIDKGTVPAVGLALARMLGHITYLSAEAMREKFEFNRLQPRELDTEFEKIFSVGSYLAHQGGKFVERFDANSYIKLSMAMDLFNLGDTNDVLAANLSRSSCRWLILSFSSDWLFPPEQSRELADTLLGLGKSVSYCNVVSSCGHDAFLLEDDLPVYGELMRAFLDTMQNGIPECLEEDDFYVHAPASIFGSIHRPRMDNEEIARLVDPHASVLDLGCGRGSLLVKLLANGNTKLMGLELNEEDVLYCLQRGLNVVQADLNSGLDPFSDGQFDCIVLSHTLQAVKDVEHLIKEMLRVGSKSIVSFPNFAYHKLRRMLYEEGRSPRSNELLRYEWYNSPNIRFFSIEDFYDFCRRRDIRVHECIALDTEDGRIVTEDPNLMADMAIFVISR
ncbi:MAG: homoserine O-acetyltransferase [Acidobacteria bacterium]|nr:homoserine O-acetyltransferase [Acidobacteriota bacterium]